MAHPYAWLSRPPHLLIPAVSGIYRQRPACALPHADRHPERTVFYRVLFHYFERFLGEYDDRFEKEYGFLRPIIKDVVERVGKYMIRPLLSLERLSLDEREGQVCYRYGKDAEEVERMDYLSACNAQAGLEFIARVTSHIPDKGQVTVRYFGLYANAHRGKARKGQPDKHPFIIVEEECPRVPRRGWAEMIRKVYEVNPLTCPKCQAEMRIIAFLTDYAVVDRIIAHLKLTFVADKPPPPHLAYQESLTAAETSAEYFF